MDFGSSYILKEEEQTEARAPSSSSSHSPWKYEDDNSGYECEIMDFEEDEDCTQPQVNTNTVKMLMKNLKEKPDVMVERSKYVTCKDLSCGAVYSHLAKIDQDKKLWICNFCDNKNEFGELEDLSDKSDVMYVEDTSTSPELKPQECRKQKIILVIDTSASMCQTTPIQLSNVSAVLKRIFDKDLEKQAKQMQIPLQDMLQALQAGENPNSIEVSRLQSIKACVIEAIEDLSKSAEQNQVCVGLVTFGETVTVHGDGLKLITVEGGQLADKNELRDIGINHAALNPVEDSAANLNQKVEMLNEQGRTALGPALIIALRMASNAPGSKVILCTDGFANIGLGKLEDTTEGEVNKFYSDVIADSIALGVSITIFCVDKAGLTSKLGQVPIETGGSLEKLVATELTMKHFLNEFKRATVAVDADIKFLVHKNMYVDDQKAPATKCSQYNKKIGNLLLDQQMSFSFAFKPNNPEPSSKPQDTDGKTKTDDQPLPFQVQINYKNISGVPVKRVWTAQRNVTGNRAAAEAAMNMKIVVETFIQQSSQQLLTANSDKKGAVKELALKFADSGSNYKRILTSLDKNTVDKLSEFVSLMNNITRQREINEDQYAQLNKLQEARLVQAQG